MIEIIPEANFGIETCKNGTKERNAVFICSETDYILHYQTTDLPYPRELFGHMVNGNRAGIVKE